MIFIWVLPKIGVAQSDWFPHFNLPFFSHQSPTHSFTIVYPDMPLDSHYGPLSVACVLFGNQTWLAGKSRAQWRFLARKWMEMENAPSMGALIGKFQHAMFDDTKGELHVKSRRLSHDDLGGRQVSVGLEPSSILYCYKNVRYVNYMVMLYLIVTYSP